MKFAFFNVLPPVFMTTCEYRVFVCSGCRGEIPQTEWLMQQKFLLTILEGGSQRYLSAGLTSLKCLSLTCRWRSYPHVFWCLSQSPCKDTSHVGLGPILMNPFHLISSLSALSLNIVILRCRGIEWIEGAGVQSACNNAIKGWVLIYI